MHTCLIIYLIGTAVTWVVFVCAAAHEPTAHGQDVLVPFGCALGFVWPLYLAWMALVSLYILYLWWNGELD